VPELPEVQTIVNGLNERVAGATIVGVWSDWEKMVLNPKSWQEFRKDIIGKKIKKVERKGKFIIFDLGETDLIVHLRMTGHFLVIDDNKRKDKNDPIHDKVNNYVHFILKLEDGRDAALSDLRKFAKIYLVKSCEVKSFLDVGIDPLDKGFTFNKFCEILKNKKGNIKQVLMDQSLIAGIGNIYSSEILWEARISPFRRVENIGELELKAIYNAIGKILRIAIKARGDSESDYRDVNGKEGGYQNIQRVYQREGKPCYRDDGGIIKRVKIGQRSGFWCDRCQF